MTLSLLVIEAAQLLPCPTSGLCGLTCENWAEVSTRTHCRLHHFQIVTYYVVISSSHFRIVVFRLCSVNQLCRCLSEKYFRQGVEVQRSRFCSDGCRHMHRSYIDRTLLSTLVVHVGTRLPSMTIRCASRLFLRENASSSKSYLTTHSWMLGDRSEQLCGRPSNV